MSWLEDRKIVYRYKAGSGTVFHLELGATEDPPATIDSPEGVATYDGFEPDVVKQTNVVAYDQNGRLAYRIIDKSGKISHISKSKYKYLKTGRVENCYTKEFQQHLEKTEQEQMLHTDENRRMAQVKLASSRLSKGKV